MATLADAIADLEVLLSLNRPVWLWSPPGTGKSDAVREVAAKLGYAVTDIRLSMFDPVDLRGLPAIVDGLTQWLRPAIWPAVDGARVILFFDEMDRAATAVANAALQIVLDRRIGEHVLPASVRIVAAGNGSTDRRGTNAISSAQANRFTHLHIQPDAETTARHFMRKGLPPVMAAFLRYRDSLVLTATAPGEYANASPRAWEAVCGMLQLPDAQRHRLIAGTVGTGPAGEFEAYYRTWRELPPLDSLIADPHGSPVPTQPGALYAVASALARKATVGNFSNVVAYLERMPVEFGISAIRDACSRDKGLMETSAFVRWQVDNQAVQL